MRASAWSRTVVVAAAVGASGCTVTPQVIPDEQIETEVGESLAALERSMAEEPISGPVGVHEAVVRTVKYNRERRVQIMTQALEQNQIQLAQFDMLPRLAVDAGYERRSNRNASSSRSIITGTESLEPSVSSSRNRFTADASLSWNVLDFGLSYVRAKQQADRYLIARERERKVVHNIAQGARHAYWRAVSAERLLERIDPLARRVEQALADSRRIETGQLTDPLDALDYQRELLETLRTLQTVKRSLLGARAELAGLMGVRPGTEFTLVLPGPDTYVVPRMQFSLEQMEQSAFVNRPELLEARYSARIVQNDARAALLRLLPGLNLSAGGHHDSNPFLVNSSWATLGASITWNLFNVFRYPAERRAADTREEVVEAQRLALYMAVLGQVHLSKVRFAEAVKDYAVARDYLRVVDRILGQTRHAHETLRAGEMQVIRADLKKVIAELRRDVAYAELQNSFVQIHVTMGLDPLPTEVASHDIPALADAARRQFERWVHGDVALLESAPDAPHTTAGAPQGGAAVRGSSATEGTAPATPAESDGVVFETDAAESPAPGAPDDTLTLEGDPLPAMAEAHASLAVLGERGADGPI